MRIATSEPETEECVRVESMGIRSWRWVLDITPLSVTIQQQLSTDKDPEWHDIYNYFSVGISPFKWGYGIKQSYYDGMWYSYRFGPFYAQWFD